MAIKLGDDAGGEESAPFSDINITPLTDIFLVLLIIFMVTSSVQVETASRSGVKVNLPKGATQEIDPGQKTLTVSVLPTGEILAQGNPIEATDLAALFQSTSAKDPDTQIIIEGDQTVQYGIIVQVIDAAKDAGLSRLGIRTQN